MGSIAEIRDVKRQLETNRAQEQERLAGLKELGEKNAELLASIEALDEVIRYRTPEWVTAMREGGKIRDQIHAVGLGIELLDLQRAEADELEAQVTQALENIQKNLSKNKAAVAQKAMENYGLTPGDAVAPEIADDGTALDQLIAMASPEAGAGRRDAVEAVVRQLRFRMNAVKERADADRLDHETLNWLTGYIEAGFGFGVGQDHFAVTLKDGKELPLLSNADSKKFRSDIGAGLRLVLFDPAFAARKDAKELVRSAAERMMDIKEEELTQQVELMFRNIAYAEDIVRTKQANLDNFRGQEASIKQKAADERQRTGTGDRNAQRMQIELNAAAVNVKNAEVELKAAQDNLERMQMQFRDLVLLDGESWETVLQAARTPVAVPEEVLSPYAPITDASGDFTVEGYRELTTLQSGFEALENSLRDRSKEIGADAPFILASLEKARTHLENASDPANGLTPGERQSRLTEAIYAYLDAEIAYLRSDYSSRRVRAFVNQFQAVRNQIGKISDIPEIENIVMILDRGVWKVKMDIKSEKSKIWQIGLNAGYGVNFNAKDRVGVRMGVTPFFAILPFLAETTLDVIPLIGDPVSKVLGVDRDPEDRRLLNLATSVGMGLRGAQDALDRTRVQASDLSAQYAFYREKAEWLVDLAKTLEIWQETIRDIPGDVITVAESLNRDANYRARLEYKLSQLNEKLINIRQSAELVKDRLRQLGYDPETVLKDRKESLPATEELNAAVRDAGSEEAGKIIGEVQGMIKVVQDGTEAKTVEELTKLIARIEGLTDQLNTLQKVSEFDWRLGAGIWSTGIFSDNTFTTPLPIDIIRRDRVLVYQYDQEGKKTGEQELQDAPTEDILHVTIDLGQVFGNFTGRLYRVQVDKDKARNTLVTREEEQRVAEAIINYETQLRAIQNYERWKIEEISMLVTKYEALSGVGETTVKEKERIRDLLGNEGVRYLEARLTLNEALRAMYDATGATLEMLPPRTDERTQGLAPRQDADRGSVQKALEDFEASGETWGDYAAKHPEIAMRLQDLEMASIKQGMIRARHLKFWGQVGLRDDQWNVAVGTNLRLVNDEHTFRSKMVQIERETAKLGLVQDQLAYEHELETLLRDFWVTGEQSDITLRSVRALGERLPGNLDKTLQRDAGVDQLVDYLTIDWQEAVEASVAASESHLIAGVRLAAFLRHHKIDPAQLGLDLRDSAELREAAQKAIQEESAEVQKQEAEKAATAPVPAGVKAGDGIQSSAESKVDQVYDQPPLYIDGSRLLDPSLPEVPRIAGEIVGDLKAAAPGASKSVSRDVAPDTWQSRMVANLWTAFAQDHNLDPETQRHVLSLLTEFLELEANEKHLPVLLETASRRVTLNVGAAAESQKVTLLLEPGIDTSDNDRRVVFKITRVAPEAGSALKPVLTGEIWDALAQDPMLGGQGRTVVVVDASQSEKTGERRIYDPESKAWRSMPSYQKVSFQKVDGKLDQSWAQDFPRYRITPSTEENLRSLGVDLSTLGFFTFLSMQAELMFDSPSFRQKTGIQTREEAHRWFLEVYRDLDKAKKILDANVRQHGVALNINDSDEFGKVWAFSYYCHANRLEVSEAVYKDARHQEAIDDNTKEFSRNTTWRKVHDDRVSKDITDTFYAKGLQAYAIAIGAVDPLTGDVTGTPQQYTEMKGWANINAFIAALRFSGIPAEEWNRVAFGIAHLRAKFDAAYGKDLTDENILEKIPGAYRARQADEKLRRAMSGEITLTAREKADLEQIKRASIEEVRNGIRLGRSMGLLNYLLHGAGIEYRDEQAAWRRKPLGERITELENRLDIAFLVNGSIEYGLAYDETGDQFGMLFAIARDIASKDGTWRGFFTDKGAAVDPARVKALLRLLENEKRSLGAARPGTIEHYLIETDDTKIQGTKRVKQKQGDWVAVARDIILVAEEDLGPGFLRGLSQEAKAQKLTEQSQKVLARRLEIYEAVKTVRQEAIERLADRISEVVKGLNIPNSVRYAEQAKKGVLEAKSSQDAANAVRQVMRAAQGITDDRQISPEAEQVVQATVAGFTAIISKGRGELAYEDRNFRNLFFQKIDLKGMTIEQWKAANPEVEVRAELDAKGNVIYKRLVTTADGSQPMTPLIYFRWIQESNETRMRQSGTILNKLGAMKTGAAGATRSQPRTLSIFATVTAAGVPSKETLPPLQNEPVEKPFWMHDREIERLQMIVSGVPGDPRYPGLINEPVDFMEARSRVNLMVKDYTEQGDFDEAKLQRAQYEAQAKIYLQAANLLYNFEDFEYTDGSKEIRPKPLLGGDLSSKINPIMAAYDQNKMDEAERLLQREAQILKLFGLFKAGLLGVTVSDNPYRDIAVDFPERIKAELGKMGITVARKEVEQIFRTMSRENIEGLLSRVMFLQEANAPFMKDHNDSEAVVYIYNWLSDMAFFAAAAYKVYGYFPPYEKLESLLKDARGSYDRLSTDRINEFLRKKYEESKLGGLLLRDADLAGSLQTIVVNRQAEEGRALRENLATKSDVNDLIAARLGTLGISLENATDPQINDALREVLKNPGLFKTNAVKGAVAKLNAGRFDLKTEAGIANSVEELRTIFNNADQALRDAEKALLDAPDREKAVKQKTVEEKRNAREDRAKELRLALAYQRAYDVEKQLQRDPKLPVLTPVTVLNRQKEEANRIFLEALYPSVELFSLRDIMNIRAMRRNVFQELQPVVPFEDQGSTIGSDLWYARKCQTIRDEWAFAGRNESQVNLAQARFVAEMKGARELFLRAVNENLASQRLTDKVMIRTEADADFFMEAWSVYWIKAVFEEDKIKKTLESAASAKARLDAEQLKNERTAARSVRVTDVSMRVSEGAQESDMIKQCVTEMTQYYRENRGKLPGSSSLNERLTLMYAREMMEKGYSAEEIVLLRTYIRPRLIRIAFPNVGLLDVDQKADIDTWALQIIDSVIDLKDINEINKAIERFAEKDKLKQLVRENLSKDLTFTDRSETERKDLISRLANDADNRSITKERLEAWFTFAKMMVDAGAPEKAISLSRALWYSDSLMKLGIAESLSPLPWTAEDAAAASEMFFAGLGKLYGLKPVVGLKTRVTESEVALSGKQDKQFSREGYEKLYSYDRKWKEMWQAESVITRDQIERMGLNWDDFVKG
ncbi:MAG: hypothetical protein KTQ49_06185, partial [Candidatus Omnitrophica bacterium]|nr:hypothetical protein [Candidatus Omnitrophota bacterium]